MLISQYGKIIRTSTDSIREAGRSTQGVRLLHLEPGDKVAAAVVIPDEEKADARVAFFCDPATPFRLTECCSAPCRRWLASDIADL
jgi:DNA gyrase/topoisomerase IV subunit A